MLMAFGDFVTGRIEVVRDDDEIAVAGIGQSLEQIRTDDIRNSS